MILATVMIVLGEGIPLVWGIVKYEAQLRWVNEINAHQREAALERQLNEDREHTLVFGRSLKFLRPVHYFLGSKREEADIVNANGYVTPFILFDRLKGTDEFDSNELKILPPNTTITPFKFKPDQYNVAEWNVPHKGQCAFASLERGEIIFIPYNEYRDARNEVERLTGTVLR